MAPPLQARLRGEAARLAVTADVVERDYAIGYVLAGLYSHPALSEALVFKGGTVLKKAYFGDYRFSVDLDFSALGGPREDALLEALREAAAVSLALATEQGPFAMEAARNRESEPHPGGQEAFTALVQFPWQRRPLCSVKIEVTVDEPLLAEPVVRPLIHGYGEDLAVDLRCYALEEIAAEKLRTLLQVRRRLERGDWIRDCARDYYDLWSLSDPERCGTDFHVVSSILPDKCAVRDVAFSAVEDFFAEGIVAQARRQWQARLANLIRPLPEFDTVIGDLQERLATHLRVAP